MKKKLTEQQQYMAYILNKDDDFSYTQKKISEMMDVSQSTISSAIAYVTNQLDSRDLTLILKKEKQQLLSYGIKTKSKKPPIKIID